MKGRTKYNEFLRNDNFDYICIFIGRIYEYRVNLRECENCKGEVGNE